MEVQVKYVIYELNKVMGSKEHLALQEVEFKRGWVSNSFDTEEAAIAALVENEMTYRDYVILKQVIVRKN